MKGEKLIVRDYNCGFPFVLAEGVQSFCAKDIFECGQCFRWEKTKLDKNEILLYDAENEFQKKQADFLPEEGEGYMTTAFGRCVKVFSHSGRLWILNSTKDDFENIWLDYFDLERDYGKIKDEISKIDDNMREAVRLSEGLRILRQEPFETLISFIVSANNNIPRIKKIIGNLARMTGKEVKVPESFKKQATETNLIYAFPDAAGLSVLTEEEISRETHAGYRCEYIVKTASAYTEKAINREKLSKMTYDEAFRYVSGYTGVGPKVADCILLFTGIKDEAFPVDVWVRRVMKSLYDTGKDSINAIRQFGRDYFGDYAGIAQEFLFVYIRYVDK